nr:DNA repair exonuclease [Caudoviricetes sp.]CAI9751049.1 DNA repair exonuclease [Caudoviricetes sp.]
MTWTSEEDLYLIDNYGITPQKEMAEHLGKKEATIRKRAQIMRETGAMLNKSFVKRQKEQPDGRTYNVKEIDGEAFTSIKDKGESELLEFVGLDPDEFAIKQSGSYFNQYADKTSLRIAFERREKPFNVDLYLDKVNSYEFTKKPPENVLSANNDMYAVLPLYDMHFGFADSTEYFGKISEVVEELQARPVKEFLIILGGDYLHSETAEGVTSSGTSIDGIDLMKAVTDATNFITEITFRAMAWAYEVKVIAIDGNHDRTSSQIMYHTLNAMGVDIEYAGEFASYQLGNVPIVMYHGGGVKKNRLKDTDYLKFIKAEMPDVLMQSLRTGNDIHWFQGHYHTTTEKTDSLYIHQVPAITKTSGWEKSNGFLGSLNGMKMYYFDENKQRGVFNL